MAYDPIRDRMTPTSSPYNSITSLPTHNDANPIHHQTPQHHRPSSGGYNGIGFSTPIGNGQSSTVPHTHHGGVGVGIGQSYISPNINTTTPHNDSRPIDRSYFSLPIRDHHSSLSAPTSNRNGSLSPIPPNGYNNGREIPSLAYPPAFSHHMNFGSVEMSRNISSGSGGGKRSMSSGSNGSGFTIGGGERGNGNGNGNGHGPGGPGFRSILNDQQPQPPLRHPDSRRSSFGIMAISPLSGPSALPGQGGKYTHEERRSITPLGFRDSETTSPIGLNQLATPSRNNSISLSMLLNDDVGSINEGKRSSFGGRPTSSSSSSLGGVGSDLVVQQVGGLDSLADAALALETPKSNGNQIENSVINRIQKRARSRSNSPRFGNDVSNPNEREVAMMSPTTTIDTPTASTDDMEPQRPLSSSATTTTTTTLRRGSFQLPTSIPGAGAVVVDPAALEKWEKAKAKKRGVGKQRRESVVSPQPQGEGVSKPVVVEKPPKVRKKSTTTVVTQQMDGKQPKDIDLTFSPETSTMDLGNVMSPSEEPPPRKKARKESFASSTPSRRESLTKESTTFPSEEMQNASKEEEGRWSPSAPSTSLIATDNAVKQVQAKPSRKVSGTTIAAQHRSNEAVSPTSVATHVQVSSDAFVVPHVPGERKASNPSTSIPPLPTSRIPYNPTHRVSRPFHMLKPISPDEIAWLRQHRRNPLARVTSSTMANRNGGRESTSSASHDRVPSGDAGIHKRRRDSDVSPTGGSGGFADPGSAVKRARDEEGDGRVIGNQYENHHVAAHYNSRKDLGKNAREHSAIFGLRKFNNWVKSVLIHRFACCRPDSEGRDQRGRPRPGRVLDMGCGKGGDLKKWDKAYIAEYIGVDIAAGSIADAKARAASERLRYSAKFYVLDCFNEPVKNVLSDEEVAPLFDNVSMQFCIHYAFSDVGRVRLMLENASRYLRKGGVFFGTTLSDHKIMHKLAEIPPGEDLVIQNDYYRIVFDEREHKGPFGHAYTFTLLDAIDECKEYVVTWSEFESLAREYGFTCVYRKDFDELFEEEHDIPESYALAEKMGVTKGGNMFMNPGEWDAATMYMAFAFEQTREPKRRP